MIPRALSWSKHRAFGKFDNFDQLFDKVNFMFMENLIIVQIITLIVLVAYWNLEKLINQSSFYLVFLSSVTSLAYKVIGLAYFKDLSAYWDLEKQISKLKAISSKAEKNELISFFES